MTRLTRFRMATAAFLCMQALTCFAPVAHAATETVVYSFQNNGKDGYFPATALTAVGSTLYGTTYYGGTGRCIYGCGAIYSVDPVTGTETILYSLRGRGSQSSSPGSLLNIGSKLYGTTAGGGHRGEGSLFSFDLESGTFGTLYSFCNLFECTDGAGPSSGLLDWKGKLYGTTIGGGDAGNTDYGGVVFSFDIKTGTETPLHSFCLVQNCTDGGDPEGGLIRVNHKLYGLAEAGGEKGNCGELFSFNPANGRESQVYAFCSQQNFTDGASPQGALIEWNGMLYGVTQLGGSGSCSYQQSGCGTVFSVDPATGTETVMHAFAQDGIDGDEPIAGLVELNGTFYGTTPGGGANNEGTVYSVDPSTGAEAVVYSFCSQKSCTDGAQPRASLTALNGTLYGTTQEGGTGTCSTYGCGTVFAITP